MAHFSRIITHVWPHLDEIVAIQLLQKHGEALFPGIHAAHIDYSGSDEPIEGKTWQQHEHEGTLLIGIGGGPFDEHPTTTAERKHGQSACMLVAKKLKLDTHPIYKRLIELVTEADQVGVHEFHIANRLKTSYRLNPKHPEKGVALVSAILDDWEHEQQMFVDSRLQLQEIIREHKEHILELPNNLKLTMIVVESPSYKMSAAARSLKVSVLIQKQPSGHVQIFCDHTRHPIHLRKVVAMIRKAECLASGMSEKDITKIDAVMLEREGAIPQAQNWFYQMPGQNILNGSETKPELAPTKIPLAVIVDIVKKYTIVE
jgi:hypothetical protein